MMRQDGDLENIPGIGKKISEKLNEIGVYKVSELKGKDPEDLYRKLELQKGRPIDRCVLYVFRCAVYFAENENHDPSLLKWWNWKDRDQEAGKRDSFS